MWQVWSKRQSHSEFWWKTLRKRDLRGRIILKSIFTNYNKGRVDLYLQQICAMNKVSIKFYSRHMLLLLVAGADWRKS
jgi:hypothetical protein